MGTVKAVVVASDIVTAFGWGVDSGWEGLLAGKTAIRRLERFSTKEFVTENAGVISELNPHQDESLVMQMLRPLFAEKASLIPRDASLILATTQGEIDILEQSVLGSDVPARESCPDRLLYKVADLSGVTGSRMIVSAACASSTAAVAQAANWIRNGQAHSVLVVGCDSLTEFVFSGFSSLGALDKNMARPFDRERGGLTLGEAAGFALIMSASRASRENRPILGEIAGWGLSNDANHLSSPSRDGSGLASAIRKALHTAELSQNEVGVLSAHGTGTVYNDSMEMKAFKTVFGVRGLPVYSVKGGIGHTLGAAGLLEVILAFRSLDERIVPPTVNLRTPDDEAAGWVSSEVRAIDSSVTLSTNSGFGGINVALVLKNAG
jgi:3-oxoacyl-[acyl-carrier-protein] synthase II